MTEASKNATDKLYDLIANEEDARACSDIPDEACREVPRNFFLILASNVLTKLGDLLTSPKTVLTWLMGTIGTPALVAWLVPIRESGSMVPQLLIGAWVRRRPVRKGFWVLGSLGQAASVAVMAASIWWLQGYAAGGVILAALVCFSLFRGFCSVAMKDVQGKCVPKGRRGRLSGLATTLGGAGTVLLTLLLFWGRGEPGIAFYTGVLLLAALMWLVAGSLFACVEEYQGETGGGGNAFRQAVVNLSLLKTDAPFRHFVFTRSCLLCSALAAPYLVLLAQQQTDSGWLLGGFLLASSLAASLSASVWGWMADQSSRQVMLRGAIIASSLCLIIGTHALFMTSQPAPIWLYPAAFFILGIAHAGVRLGRKTYLVDMAGGNKRTDYTSVSNTLAGVLLLVVGGLSAAVSFLSEGAVIIMLGLLGLVGTLSAQRLPEV
ncbi:MAG: MFS transporter [Marinobacter sp.]|uniref:MFS transporter n=1 Tax=Marinobacter sp. TaxID=50741 RepID=UPI00299D6934|nr:MFS transporter [Marinobacter sp.]MDX1756532.1 MFS transporter [Marinobacter sp.]